MSKKYLFAIYKFQSNEIGLGFVAF